MNTDEIKAFFQKNRVALLAIGGVLLVGGLVWILASGGSKSGTKKAIGPTLAGLDVRIKQDLASPALGERFTDRPRRQIIESAMREFYSRRDYKPVWLTDKGLAAETDSALNILTCSYQEGLEPGNYSAKDLSTQRDSIVRAGITKLPLAYLSKFETELTANLFQYATHITTGRINPASLDSTWKFEPRLFDVAAFFDSVPAANLPHAVAHLLPQTPEYAALRGELGRYRSVAAQPWPTLPSRQIDSGARGPAVLALNRRLHLANLLDSTTAKSDAYGPATAMALRMFYLNNGMFSKGYANADVIALLNQPPRFWIRQIELNLERRRWIGPLPERYLFVNIPEYRLRAYDNGKPTLDMEVVVGDEYHSTPIFTGKLEYCIFNPDWIITDNIARKEVLPILQRNPAFLQHDSIDVMSSWKPDATVVDPATVNWTSLSADTFPYKLVQKAGKRNPLGRIKFIFPNDASIYLHDTPFRWAFHLKERSKSHGCIRLQRPMELAGYLLKDSDAGSKDTLDALVKNRIQRQVNFKQPERVYLVYLTAWVDDQGKLNHRPDLYGHDARHIQAIYEKEQKLMAAR